MTEKGENSFKIDEDVLSDLTIHGLLDKCQPGCLPANVKKELVNPARAGDPSPPYPPGSRLRFQFRTTSTDDEHKVFDDSRKHPKPMEIIIGKKFKVEIWELALNTMRLHEVARFIVPRSMCVLYPMVAKVLRDSFKPSNTPGSKSCCGSMLNGTGHPDLDELLKTPISLTFTFELLEVALPGQYEMESWYMTDDQKLESLVSLQEAGNQFFAQQKYKEATEKYFEAIARIEQLLTREVPGSDEMKDLQHRKIPLLLNFAFCKQKEKDYYESIIHNNSVLELDPDNIKALFRRGQCHKFTGSYDLARQDFERAVQLDVTLVNAVRRELEEMLAIQQYTKETEKQRYQRMFNQ